MQRRTPRLANSVGILATDTWRYYVDNFQCSHFLGTGIEDNYYLFQPFYLRNGQLVNSRRRFFEFISEFEADEGGTLTEGIHFVVSDHLVAVRTARILIHPELVELEEFNEQLLFIRNRNQYFHPSFLPNRAYSRYLAVSGKLDSGPDKPDYAECTRLDRTQPGQRDGL